MILLKSGENYFPYSSFKDLVRPGMQFGELGEALCDRLGLPHRDQGYIFITRRGYAEAPQRIKSGLWLFKAEYAYREMGCTANGDSLL